jgi:hypothetical protein
MVSNGFRRFFNSLAPIAMKTATPYGQSPCSQLSISRHSQDMSGMAMIRSRFPKFSDETSSDPSSISGSLRRRVILTRNMIYSNIGDQRIRVPRKGVIETGSNLRYERLTEMLEALWIESGALFDAPASD